MLRMEAENKRRERLGKRQTPLPASWTERPKLADVEMAVFNQFIEFAAFCSGELDPSKALSWFEIQGVSSADRPWLGKIYSILSPILKEDTGDSKPKR